VADDASAVSFFYQFPAWSLDGKSLAFVGVRRNDVAVMNAGIWTAPTGKTPLRVYSSDDQVPRFLSWSPDSSRLVFESPKDPGLQQLATVSAGGGDVRILGEGSAFAWRWKSGAPGLAVHSVKDASVERVSILDPKGLVGDEDLTPVPGIFEAPAWSADGQGIIMAVSENAGSTLYFEDRGGADAKPLAQVQGAATFDLSPDGRRLAWSAAGRASVRSLYVLDLPGGRPSADAAAASVPGSVPRPVTGNDFVEAFFWSPDGSKIAYFVPDFSSQGGGPAASSGAASVPAGTTDQGRDLQLTLKVLEVKTGTVRTVATFHPSPYFNGLLMDYGQYAESVRLWSPDGRFLLYCEMQPDSFDIMVAYADQPIAPRKIADGLIATWSPR
jgi:TolB protein